MLENFRKHVLFIAALASGSCAWAAPDHVDITWMSIANMHFAVGQQRIVADGYITRLPQEIFRGGATGVASTTRAARSDRAAVSEVFEAIGGKSAVHLLLTGHSHFDHSFDTPSWADLSGARIMGSPTTCFQVRAAGIPADRCTPVFGGEKVTLEPGVEMHVIRWNHSGDPAKNAEQHNPVELRGVPTPGPDGFRAGVAEDFPNGGGNRAYLFTVARNHLINQAKRGQVVSIELVSDMSSFDNDFDRFGAERQLSAREELRRTQQGLDQLPPRCRQVVWLRKVEGLSTRETADRLGITVDTVEKQITQGMRALVDYMLGGSGKIRRPLDPRRRSRSELA